MTCHGIPHGTSNAKAGLTALATRAVLARDTDGTKRIIQVLVGAGAVAIERDREIIDSQFGNNFILSVSSGGPSFYWPSGICASTNSASCLSDSCHPR